MRKLLLSIAALLCASTINLFATEGALSGQFTINAAGDKIAFSQGNLQYQASTKTWRFAENQYDTIGAANKNISSTYTGWIDLFGWGTGSNPTETSTNSWDYATFTDWGVNKISNGGNEANLWRTLTKDEWVYLFYGRTNAATLFALGSVNGVNGTILLPDNWVLPTGASFTASTTKGLADQGDYYYDKTYKVHFADNTYTEKQWEVMESAGAVFWPAAGLRDSTDVQAVGEDGSYWSATPDGPYAAYCPYFYALSLRPLGGSNYNYAHSVRLVQPYESEPQVEVNALPGQFTINAAGDKIAFSQGNLQDQASTKTWRFAENQYDTIGAANKNISSTYDGWIDLFGWGTGSNPTETSTDYNDYATFTDWGVNKISNGGNEANLWRTLTKNEWVYLFYTRENAATLFALGSVNGVNGTILLPDNWVLPTGASFTASTTQGLTDQGTYYYNENGTNFSHNTYTAEQWSKMESAGAVFLPAAGYRDGTDVDDVGSNGNYWAATPYDTYGAYHLYFYSYDLGPQIDDGRYLGFSVRLVR